MTPVQVVTMAIRLERMQRIHLVKLMFLEIMMEANRQKRALVRRHCHRLSTHHQEAVGVGIVCRHHQNLLPAHHRGGYRPASEISPELSVVRSCAQPSVCPFPLLFTCEDEHVADVSRVQRCNIYSRTNKRSADHLPLGGTDLVDWVLGL